MADKVYKCTAELEAENKRLKDGLEKIIAEGNKPNTQAAYDEGNGPNPYTMVYIAEQALKGT
jgi:hypothetical protein